MALLAAACGGPPAAELVPSPHPALDVVDADAREQLEEARSRVDGLETANAAPDARSEALGELGRLYHGYDFDAAARAAYRNALALAGEDFRLVLMDCQP